MTRPIGMHLNIVQTSGAPLFTQLSTGVAIQELGLHEASRGLFSARRVRTAASWRPEQIAGDAQAWLTLVYLVDGTLTVRVGGNEVTLRKDDAVCQVPLSPDTVLGGSSVLEFIEIHAPDTPAVRELIPQRPQPMVSIDAPERHEIGTGPRDFFDYRDLGLAGLTGDQVEVQVIRARRARQGGTGWHMHTMAQLSYGLSGWASLGVEGHQAPVLQRPGDAFSIPPGCVHNADSFSDDYWALQMQIPARYDTEPRPDPRNTTNSH